MLKSVVIKNFVHFSNFTKVKLDEGTNIMVGPNGSGKSSFFEMIRRCMSNTINHSLSPIAKGSESAFTICEYRLGAHPYKEGQGELKKDTTLLTAVVYNDKKSNFHKLCQIIEADDKTLLESFIDLYRVNVPTSLSGSFDTDLLVKTDPVDNDKIKKCLIDLLACDESETNDAAIFTDLLDLLPEQTGDRPSNEKKRALVQHSETTDMSQPKNPYVPVSNKEETGSVGNSQEVTESEETSTLSQSATCEPILQFITDKYFVATFGLRGISNIHWTRSDHMDRKNRLDNYKKSTESAEILNALLSDKDNIDIELEKKIFKRLVHPSVYTFERGDDKTKVSDGTFEFPLVKIPSGVLEAKQFSLILAHKHFKTICLEEPDRSMQSQMIGRMLEFLFWDHADSKKVILLQSHNHAMVNFWTMKRTFVFRRPHGSAVSVKKPDIERGAFSREDVLKIPFASYVLVLEGAGDKRFVKRMIRHILKDDDRVGAMMQTKQDGKNEQETIDMVSSQHNSQSSNKQETNLPIETAEGSHQEENVQGTIADANYKVQIDEFKIFLGNLHIIELGGSGDEKKMRKITESINMKKETFYIFDRDKIFPGDSTSKRARHDSEVREYSTTLRLDAKELYGINSSPGDNLDAIDDKLEETNIMFIWRNGNLEEMVKFAIRGDLDGFKRTHNNEISGHENPEKFDKFLRRCLDAKKIKEKSENLTESDMDILAKFIIGNVEGKRLFRFLNRKWNGLRKT